MSDALGGVSESTVRRLIASGYLESAKVGRRRMVTAESLERLLERVMEGGLDA
ncbi:MAG: helix-turn-helix domain-containing protein [Acidimicrobiia bacterium]